MQSPLYFETKNDVPQEIESAFHISEGGRTPREVYTTKYLLFSQQSICYRFLSKRKASSDVLFATA